MAEAKTAWVFATVQHRKRLIHNALNRLDFAKAAPVIPRNAPRDPCPPIATTAVCRPAQPPP